MLNNKPHTEESKQKIRNSLLRQYKDGTRKTPEALYSKESVIKSAKSRTGIKRSDDVRKKLSLCKLGSKNPQWKEDRSTLQINRRNDYYYREWRKEIRKRDRNECQLKDATCTNVIHTHHIIPWSKDETLRYDIKNGITLCSIHHPRKRKQEEQLIPILLEIINKKY